MPSTMTSQRLNLEKALLPLIVAVTGHRDLGEDEGGNVARQVRQLFVTLRDTYPHTPIILLSSLAEGADRLVARAALDCGIELYIVLPMQLDVYEQDFGSKQSLEEFRELMRSGCDASVVPMADDRDAHAARVPGPARDRRYAAAGAFMVSYSQILIALWDGSPDEMLGGTSQIVRFALQGVPPKYLSGSKEPLRTNETGAVYHVRVNRASQPASSLLGVATWLYPGADVADEAAVRAVRAAFDENLRSLECFNRDATTPSLGSQARTSAEYLLPSNQAAFLNADGVILEYTRSLFGLADALALRCRNWTHAAMTSIFFAIGAAAILFSLYTNLFPDQMALYVGFLTLVAIAFAVDMVVSRKRMQDRFQDYRALAEGFRVQFYWRLAGIPESVYDHYLARQEGELEWIRNAMRASRFRRQIEPATELASGKMQALLELIHARWIGDQGAYFSQAVGNEREKANRIKSGARTCLIVTGIVAAVLMATLIEHASAYRGILIMVLTLALAGAGLFTGYTQKRAHEEHARRYQRMCVLYKISGERVSLLLREGDLAGVRSVLLQLGREALAETCDWLLLHRERQIDVPTA
jgi:hypothetical protein